jgi:hypothetical protein
MNRVSKSADFRAQRGFSRRELLQIGSVSLMGLSLPQWLAAQEQVDTSPPEQGSSFGRAKACILLFMWGGPAHQDTWDLKPDAPAEFRGEFRPISTKVTGTQVCEHFPLLAQRTDQLAIIRSMTHSDVNHTSATHFLLTGEAPPQSLEPLKQWPHIGSVLARLRETNISLPSFISLRPKLDNTVPRFVEESQGQFAGWLGPQFDPMTIDQNPDGEKYRIEGLELLSEISMDRLSERRKLAAALDQVLKVESTSLHSFDINHRRAFDLISSATHERGAFNLHEESDQTRERYGLNPHGQSVLQARRLVERGVPLVTVFWPNDGIKNVSVYWDTHSRNFVDLKERLMPVADQAFSALLDDLAERGLLDETLVVWTGEFGRTPRVGQRNSDAGAGADGRDHWPGCFTSVLAGAGVNRGIVYGQSDKHAAYPARDPVVPRDLIATIYHLLGVKENTLLPDMQGRPQFVRPGTVIKDLLA